MSTFCKVLNENQVLEEKYKIAREKHDEVIAHVYRCIADKVSAVFPNIQSANENLAEAIKEFNSSQLFLENAIKALHTSH